MPSILLLLGFYDFLINFSLSTILLIYDLYKEARKMLDFSFAY